MKIRVGFVSNSSTSSFLIWGVYDPEISLEKLFAIEGLKGKWATWYKEQQDERSAKYPDWYPDTTFEEWAVETFESNGFGELLDSLKQCTDALAGLKSHSPYDDCYIGGDPRAMDDEETIGSFKKRVCDTLAMFIEGEFECGWQEQSWRDG